MELIHDPAEQEIVADALMNAQVALMDAEKFHSRAAAEARAHQVRLRRVTARLSGLDPEPTPSVLRFQPHSREAA